MALTGPNTSAAFATQNTGPDLGSPVRRHTSTVGESVASNFPGSKFGPLLGSGTKGGRKKKSGAPSRISATGRPIGGDCRTCLSVHAEMAAVAMTTNAQRFMGTAPVGGETAARRTF